MLRQGVEGCKPAAEASTALARLPYMTDPCSPGIPAAPRPDRAALRGMLADPGHLLALGFGSGLSPRAPGTAGTLVGVGLWALLPGGSGPALWLAAIAAALVGPWLCGRTARALGVHDHPAIVWDEVAGYLLTMAIAPAGLGWALAGFLAFRLFDIWKPGPIGLIDRRLEGGWGIMADDLAAGLAAGLVLRLMDLLT